VARTVPRFVIPANLSGFVTSPWLGSLSSTWKRYHAAKKE
jgi:hypothetical protein